MLTVALGVTVSCDRVYSPGGSVMTCVNAKLVAFVPVRETSPSPSNGVNVTPLDGDGLEHGEQVTYSQITPPEPGSSDTRTRFRLIVSSKGLFSVGFATITNRRPIDPSVSNTA